MKLVKKLLAASLIAICGIASAAGYPNRPVKIIVPYSAGGGTDGVARLLAIKLGARWGQSVIVDNKPGAGSTLGTTAAVQSPPDGYTLLLTGNTLTVSAATYRKLPYDALRDLVPITLVSDSAFMVAVPGSLGVTTLGELIALARKQPGKLNYASSGSGTMAHLCGELLQQATGIDVVHVPFKGSSPALNATIAGQVEFLFQVPPSVMPHLGTGKLKALAVTSPARLAAFSDVPTIAESGVKGFDVTIWFGLMAPKGTPEPVLREVREAVTAVLADEEVRKRLASEGMDPKTSSSAEFTSLIKAELPKWAAVVKKANLKPE